MIAMTRRVWAVFFLILIWLAFYYSRIGLLSGPMHGSAGDLAGWEYSGYYLWENLQWLPWPSLTFDNNLHFYPDGISPVFMSWGLERDYFYALGFGLFGHGPWLPIYFGLSMLVLALSIFKVAASRIGVGRAFGLAVVASFLNSYSIHKFPGHFGIAVHHWASLSLVVDFFILWHFFRRESPPITLILARALATFGSLGLELGYIGGMSLTSGVVMVLVLGIVSLSCFLRNGEWVVSWRRLLKDWREEWSQHRLAICLLGGLCVAYAFLMLPLLGSIMLEIRSQESAEIMTGGWHVKPVRLFLPLVEPFYTMLAGWIRDAPEGYLAGSVGWYLLIPAAFGLRWAWRRQQWYVLPVVLILAMVVLYRPGRFSLLGLFPWFSYARVGPRFTLFYPVALGLLAFGVPWFRQLSRRKVARVVAGLSVLFLVLELPLLYSYQLKQRMLPELSDRYLDYMKLVAETPGEAVLDFPFCYQGGNGGGYCPHHQLWGVWANRKYHGKKVLGTYFGRLVHEHADFYRQYGLHQLMEAQDQRCLTEKELTYLKSFFESHDFCCMNLYVDFIPPACRDGFAKVFGEPAVEAPLEGVGTTRLYLSDKLPGLDHEQRFSWDRYRTTEIFDELRELYPFNFVVVAAEVREIYRPFEKFFSFKLHDLSEAFDRRQPHLLLLDSKADAPDAMRYHRIFQRSSHVAYFSSGDEPRRWYVRTDLVDRARTEDVSQALDSKIDPEERLIFLHPSHLPARLTFPALEGNPGDMLRFGLRFDNDRGDAIFKVRINDAEVFAFRAYRKFESHNIQVPLPAGLSSPFELVLEVDPNGSHNFDWAYWIAPQILSKVDPATPKL